MNAQTASALAIAAAMFVLVSAMLDPRVSLGAALVLLVLAAAYKVVQRRQQER